MKRLTYISSYAFILSMLALVGCSKQELPEPDNSSPIFEVHGTLGNNALDIVAGDNNAYMYTSTKIYNGVRVFTGELSDGETSIEFGLFDGNIDMPNSIPVIDLQNTSLKFARRHNDPLAVLNMESIVPNQNGTYVEWYVNGSYAGAGQISIYEPGKYDVCANVTFLSGQTEQLCDEIILGYERNANCNIALDLSQGYIDAEINTTGESVQDVQWFLNDSFIDSGLNVVSQISNGIGNKLSALVTFNNGVVREKSCFIDGSDPSQWISDFSVFELGSVPSIDPQDYQARLIIEKDGKTYRSIESENIGSTITLISLEPYQDNANGNNTFKATLQIEAIVMEMSTEKLIPVSFTTSLGVEIP